MRARGNFRPRVSVRALKALSTTWRRLPQAAAGPGQDGRAVVVGPVPLPGAPAQAAVGQVGPGGRCPRPGPAPDRAGRPGPLAAAAVGRAQDRGQLGGGRGGRRGGGPPAQQRLGPPALLGAGRDQRRSRSSPACSPTAASSSTRSTTPCRCPRGRTPPRRRTAGAAGPGSGAAAAPAPRPAPRRPAAPPARSTRAATRGPSGTAPPARSRARRLNALGLSQPREVAQPVPARVAQKAPSQRRGCHCASTISASTSLSLSSGSMARPPRLGRRELRPVQVVDRRNRLPSGRCPDPGPWLCLHNTTVPGVATFLPLTSTVRSLQSASRVLWERAGWG